MPDAPAVWIDAAGADAAPPLFGLGGVERLARTLGRLGVPRDRIALSEGTEPAGARLAAHLAQADRPVVALDGGALTDPRLIARLVRKIGTLVVREAEGAALSLIPADASRIPADAPDLASVADALIDAGAPRLTQAGFDGFVGVLRRDLPFHIRRARGPDEARALERWLFFSNYKGSTDLLTRWVFPPLVWPITRWCAARRVHPNTVTWLSIALAVLAAWLFAAQHFWPGLAAAYAMAVLDSVDGKLARVTLTDSALGNVLDHGLDIVHPPFWYLAWAWGLVQAGADPLLWTAAWSMVGLYVLDRLLLMLAKARFGRGLHAMTPLDATVRSVISRRNTNLAILTVGLAVGANETAFIAVVAWQGATALWHAARTALLYPKGRPA